MPRRPSGGILIRSNRQADVAPSGPTAIQAVQLRRVYVMYVFLHKKHKTVVVIVFPHVVEREGAVELSPRPKTPQQQRKEERREEKRGDRRRERRGERGREGDGGGGGGAAGACFSLQWADNEPRVGHSDVRRMGAGEAASLNT